MQSPLSSHKIRLNRVKPGIFTLLNYLPKANTAMSASNAPGPGSQPYSPNFGPMEQTATHKAVSPAAERNKQPILEVIKGYIPEGSQGLQALTVAEGSGQHVSFFAAAYPGIQFQPSDMTTEMFDSVMEYCSGLPNVKAPVLLDLTQQKWSVPSNLDILIAINVTHISPWEATLGLMSGAARHLAPGGRLFIYGPFKKDNQHTAESNEAFDQRLQIRNPQWGYRDLQQVTDAAAAQGLRRDCVHDMPANNFMMAFTFAGQQGSL